MIYITGDTHGNIDFLKLKLLGMAHPELTKNDYVIVAGDFGGVWSPKTMDKDLRPFQELPYTVLFVDGNHENFDIIDSFPVEIWHGGKVHFIRPDIIHLMRGQVFEIEGKTFFTFGGGTSIDKMFREEGTSWWPQEIPNEEEIAEGMANLKRYNNTVDFIITHSIDEESLGTPPLRGSVYKMKAYEDNRILSQFEKIVNYRHWYFGHYHMDGDLSERKTVLYQAFIPLK